ncbi:MAG: hypothetical protein NVSMB29_09260 [Candidatus Dormibacteria bacterium]
MSDGASPAELARYAVRPLLPGPLDALRETVLRLGAGPHLLPALAQYGAAEAFAIRGLAPDQTRVLEREAGARGCAVLSSPNGDRVVLLGSVLALGSLPSALVAWGRSTEALGAAIRQALVGRGAPPSPLRAGRHRLDFGGRTHVMGIVNATDDSFSGDGLGSDVDAAEARAQAMVAAGASLIDVGGESTRPGSTPVPQATEVARVVPVVRRLAASLEVAVSVDTRNPAVARAAVEAGATIVNDIWGLRRDPAMVRVLVDHPEVACVAMHNAPTAEYGDLLEDIGAALRDSLRLAEDAGVSASRIAIDPGFGFAKTPAHNLELIRRLGELRGLGRPILVGPSRKHTIGLILDGAPPEARLEGTLALAVLAAQAGADIVRVHDVAECMRALRVADAVLRGTPASVSDAAPPGPTG